MFQERHFSLRQGLSQTLIKLTQVSENMHNTQFLIQYQNPS